LIRYLGLIHGIKYPVLKLSGSTEGRQDRLTPVE
jgi:hypothetical protein